MTTYTPCLNPPFIEAAQAQKHVTHNAALERLDIIVQLQVQQFGAATPPTLLKRANPGPLAPTHRRLGQPRCPYRDILWRRLDLPHFAPRLARLGRGRGYVARLDLHWLGKRGARRQQPEQPAWRRYRRRVHSGQPPYGLCPCDAGRRPRGGRCIMMWRGMCCAALTGRFGRTCSKGRDRGRGSKGALPPGCAVPRGIFDDQRVMRPLSQPRNAASALRSAGRPEVAQKPRHSDSSA